MSAASKVCYIILSTFIGAFIGIIVSLIIANSLVEITRSTPFAIVFGVAFCLLGLAIFYRVYSTPTDSFKRILVFIFAILIIVSGIFCFVIPRDAYDQYKLIVLILIYSLLSISLAFALAFSITEFLNMGLCDKCRNIKPEDPNANIPIVGSKGQVITVFAGALVIGIAFGIAFADIDPKNSDSYEKQIIVSIPIGVVTGAVVGFLVQWLRSMGNSQYMFKPLAQEERQNL